MQPRCVSLFLSLSVLLLVVCHGEIQSQERQYLLVPGKDAKDIGLSPQGRYLSILGKSGGVPLWDVRLKSR